jgi:hypothetical protein
MCIIFKPAADVTKLMLEEIPAGNDSPQAHYRPAYRTSVKKALHRMRAVHTARRANRCIQNLQESERR